MTYLQLVNNVLTRLRENPTTQATLDSGNDVYINFIGTAVNDAKDRVEDAWQWGALRGTDDISLDPALSTVSGPRIELTDSADNDYIIKRVLLYPNQTGAPSLAGVRDRLRWTNVDRIRQRYADPTNAGSGTPSEFAVTGTAEDSGNIVITLWPFPTNSGGVGDYWLEVDRVHHQATLALAATKILVPSLPVYTLATALASRERGEVGGTPTSELFTIADRHLGDSIAQDSALYANELDWWANDNEFNTNVRFA